MNFTSIKSFLFNNQSLKQTIFKNSFWLIVAEAIDGGIGFLLIVWLARIFGPDVYGSWAFALSFVSFFVILADFGLSVLVVREVAREKSKASEYIDNILAIKVVLGLTTFLLIVLAIYFFNRPALENQLVYYLGAYTIINTFGAFFHAIFKAYEKMEYETITRIVQSLSLIVLVGFFIFIHQSIIAVALGYITSTLIGVLVSWFFVWRYFSRFFLKLNWTLCKKIFHDSFSIGLVTLTVVVLYYFAPVILGVMRSSKEVALYNIAFNTSFLVGPVSTILFASFFPQLSRAFGQNKESITQICRQCLAVYLFFIFPYFFGGLAIATELISFLYKWSFSEAILPFKILLFGSSLGFISSAFSGFLLAFNKQKDLLNFTLFGAILNIILNLWLIPLYGVLGASWAYVISVLVVLGLTYWDFKKIVWANIFWPAIVNPLIASLVMFACLLVFLEFNLYNPIYLIIGGSFIYVSVFGLLFYLEKSMIAFLKKIYKKILPNFDQRFMKDLASCQSILDLGCGPNSPIKNAPAVKKVGVELFDEYLIKSRQSGIHQEYIQEDILKVDFPPKSFDAVVMIDVIEHIKKDEALVLLKKIKGWAKKKVILLTPQGFVHQEDHHNHLQDHLSGWEVEDFEKLGFKVYGINGLKFLRGEHAYLKFRPIWLWIIISDITQQLVFKKPKWAFHLYAVLDLD